MIFIYVQYILEHTRVCKESQCVWVHGRQVCIIQNKQFSLICTSVQMQLFIVMQTTHKNKCIIDVEIGFTIIAVTL